MTTLKLVLKKKWFDMIAIHEKKEEYRELTPYYLRRLVKWYDGKPLDNKFVEHFLPNLKRMLGYLYEGSDTEPIELRHDRVTFYMGYAKNRPTMERRIAGITIGKGLAEWGAEPNKEYFIIKLED
jgi:hypothetical protein